MKWVVFVATVAIVGGATLSHAEINCAQVNRYLQTGRSVQDVSETMVIPEEEIRKCQEQAKKKDGGSGEAAEKKE